MSRPAHIWWWFAAASAVVLASLLGISAVVWRLENRDRQAQLEADQEQRYRLALWRLDAAIAVVIATENARPTTDYVAPSPLSQGSPMPARLHFQVGGGGRLTAPGGDAAELERVRVLLGTPLADPDPGELAILNQSSGARVPTAVPPPSASVTAGRGAGTIRPPSDSILRDSAGPTAGDARAPKSLSAARSAAVHPDESRLSNSWLLKNAADAGVAEVATEASAERSRSTERPGAPPAPAAPALGLEGQARLNRQEANARAQNYDNSRKQILSQSGYSPATPGVAASSGFKALRRAVENDIQSVGPLAPVWLGEELFLVRRVRLVAGEDRLQAVWLAWPQWAAQLAASVSDLLPNPRLQPVRGSPVGGEDRRLVALPVRLEADPGNFQAVRSSARWPAWTPVRIALGLAWLALLGAAAAVAWLLHGSVQLSERRAAFVSAVTHELRTPLTTFKLYSEMLADDMISDPAQRRSYLETLRAEATRLGHLVENVLAYSRLERGRTERPRETVTVDALIQRVRERLDQRVAQAGMELVIAPRTEASPRVSVDVGLMEQVLFNLVDNACKYAGPAVSDHPEARWLHLEPGSLPGRMVTLRLRDHGPGVAPEVRRRLFQPFSKSAEQAAHSAPGVGLGLSLCRQLVRSQGGDLVLESSEARGSVFTLRLPRV